NVHLATEEHHPPASGYVKVAFVLVVFTAIEVAVYYIEPLRVLDLLAPILLVLSVLKFCGIGGWYMHLKMDHKLFFVFFAAGVCLAGTVIIALMSLFGELTESGKPIQSISTALQLEAVKTPGALAYEDQLGGSPIGNAELGRQFWVLRGCTGCHIAPGIPSGGQIGPNQTHFSQRPTIAGGLLANTPANVELWLKDPPAVKPGTLMPNLSLTDEQIKDLTAFLYSLP
ncbi:MAG TPA: c-type cytochrome, partial [Chloroflexota bacterium]|nr:c-type cytochrome [Chloroflexota bacterium]